ncbi:MAG: oxidoreductase, partial [Bacteroidales bacterium]|nr:oxidoreductase [Bacteroidales bacterium]
KFVRREVKRGHLYDGIILDPPAYGHGPDGEKWKLDELLFEMLRGVSSILNPDHGWMVLNLYSNGYSAALGETVVREAFGLSGNKRRYTMQSGELALDDRYGKSLPLSIFVRLEL